MTPAELIEFLKTLPQDKPIICQVCGSEGGAWMMDFKFHDIPGSWMVQLRVFHTQLKKLPNIETEN